MPHSGVQLKLDRSGRRHRRSAARPRSARARTTCWPRCVAEVLGIDPFDIRVVTGDTDLTPVDLGSLLEPRDADDGQRRDPGGRARARAARRGGRRRSSSVPPDRARVRRAPRVRRRGPEQRRDASPRRCMLAEAKFGTLGTTGSLHAAALAGQVQGRAASARRPPTRTPRRRRGRGRSRDRLDPRAEGLDRARHRPRAQPGAGARAGRGQRLHGRSARR